MNTDNPKNDSLPLHPIQLVRVALVQMVFTNIKPPSLATRIDPTTVAISHSPGGVNVEKRSFTHFIRASYNISETSGGMVTGGPDSAPFAMFLELMGAFNFADIITEDVVAQFQKMGAASMLLPYLREHAYTITMRGGVSPIILPLTMVPVIRISKEGKLLDRQ